MGPKTFSSFVSVEPHQGQRNGPRESWTSVGLPALRGAGGRPNVLGATLNAKLGASWQREVARALQTWATVANLNFVRVADASLPLDAWGSAQGDPRFGDIRVGGYPFASTTTLAQTYFPPPGSSTSPGDVQVNTAMNWSIGNAGYDLIEATDGEAGIAMAMQHRPDLILMDIQLPVIDGYEATRRIKAEPSLAHIPIIAVTSYALSGDDVRAREAGCDSYVAKPFSPRRLLAIIREFLPAES